MGTPATTGRTSDSSMRARIDSPRSFDTGRVRRAEGRRMRGWGRGRMWSFEVVIVDGERGEFQRKSGEEQGK